MRRAAILAYHPVHVVENTYAGNDLIALAEDLATIDSEGWAVRSLEQVITPAGSPSLLADLPEPVVVITFDDGSVLDFVDRDHPTCGPQRSAATILRQAAQRLKCLSAAKPLASTFVIASPLARAELDRKDYLGLDYWNDGWWRAAAAEGVLSVESHSWDHNHPSLARTAQRANEKGTFRNIETPAEAEAEIAASLTYIAQQSGIAPRFFAYPWGEASDYLHKEYLPAHGPALGLRAALSCAPMASGFVDADSDRWLVPRLVCGHDWKSSGELASLLKGMR